MPASGWSESMASGARQVDAPSEGLFFLLERLFAPGVECKRHNGWCPRDGCGKVSALLRFLERNFAAQDQLMDEAGYPGAEEHRQAHAIFLAHLRSLYDSHACGDWEEQTMHAQVTQWAVAHAAEHDRRLGQWLIDGAQEAPVVRMPERDARPKSGPSLLPHPRRRREAG